MGCPSPVLSGSRRLGGQERHQDVQMLCDHGQVNEAVQVLEPLVERGLYVPNNLFYRPLKRCISQKELALGRHIHKLTLQCGSEGDAFLATHLISLYGSQGRLEEALRVFSTVRSPSAHNWASIISAYARQGEPSQAIRLYQQMLKSAVKADNRIFVAVLNACATAGDLVAGRDVHAHILASAVKPDLFVLNCLVDMYAKCKSLEDARGVFENLPQKDVVTWNGMIAGYVQRGWLRRRFIFTVICSEKALHDPILSPLPASCRHVLV